MGPAHLSAKQRDQVTSYLTNVKVAFTGSAPDNAGFSILHGRAAPRHRRRRVA